MLAGLAAHSIQPLQKSLGIAQGQQQILQAYVKELQEQSQTLDAGSNLRAQDRMKQLATKPELIVPGHDAAVMQKFPKTADGVVRID